MNQTALRTLIFAGVAASAVGCQSGPRWAWWKKDGDPQDKSLIARSAGPELPSAQTTPQVAAAAVPPSSANLAGATTVTTPSIPALSVPGTSILGDSSATIAAAPTATYPSTVAAAPQSGAPAAAASPSASLASSQTPAAYPAATQTGLAGPYDPNAYQPTTGSSPAAQNADLAGSPPAAPVDRYGMPAVNRYGMNASTASATSTAAAPPAVGSSFASPQATALPAENVANAGAPSQSAPQVDRYGSMPVATPTDRYAAPPALAHSATAQPAAAQSTAGASTDSLAGQPPTGGNAASHSASGASTPTAIVQLTAPAGQYRPGGTSSYSLDSMQHRVDVATRPTTPPVSPTGSGAPWGSDASPFAPAGSAPPTRPY